MAFSPTYETSSPGAAVGNREDLENTLTILAPEQTPVLSSADKVKATGVYHEWVVDGLSAVSTAGIVEGADVTSFTDKFANRARLGNRVQKLRRDFMVSDWQNAVESVGPVNLAQSESKAVLEIKRDIEACLCSTNDRTQGDDGIAAAMRGLDKWIQATGPSDVPAAYRTPTASINASGTTFNETAMNNVITSMFRVTGATNGLTLVADTALRRVIADFARTSASGDYSVRNVITQGTSSTIKLSVSMYESDHGMVSIVNMNPDCAPDTTNKDTGYFINNGYLAVAELIGLGSRMVPNAGGGDRGYVDWSGTLVVRHPGAFGKVTALS